MTCKRIKSARITLHPEIIHLHICTISPLVLLLQSPYPNTFSRPERSPLAAAVVSNNHEAVETLLACRAAANVAARGQDSPLCVAV